MTAERKPSAGDRLFRAVLRVLPFEFRADYGRDMEQTFRAQRRDAHGEGNNMKIIRIWVETIRDVFTTAPREHLAILRRDVEYALRVLRGSRVFAAAAILSIAVGASGAVSVFSVINAFMFRPLPVERPDELVSISTLDGHVAFPHGLSFPDLQDYRVQRTGLTDLLAYVPRPAALDAGRGTERVTLELVTDNYFSLLGIQPALGRVIQPNEGRARGDAPVLVLTHDYWQSRLDGDPSVVGRSVRVNGRPFVVIGVTPRAFTGTEALVRVVGYVPLWMYDDLMNTSGTSFLERRDAHSLNVLGRLRAGTSLAQARAGLAVASDGLAGQYPATNKEVRLLMVPETSARPTPNIGPMFRIVATVLAGLAALLLVITSLNVANLLVARAATRGREVALRSALGAQRGRLVRQFVTESLVLALMGTALAIPVVVLAMRGLEQSFTQMTSAATVRPDFSLDVRVLAAALAVATLSGIISGLAPTVFAFRGDLNALLKTGGRGAPAPVRNRLRGALVVAQVAVSLALLVSGGLFARSLQNARHIDLGFQSDGILLASTAPGLQGYSPAQRLAFYRNVGDRVAEIPGVERAAWISWPPFATVYQNTILSPEGQAQDSDVQGRMAYIAHISPDYLSTVRIPVIEGRMFDERDDGTAARVAIVNETLAKRFWPGQNATGRQLSLGNETVNVVGVVRDGKYVFLWEAPSAMVFRPLTQDVPTAATIAVRTTRLPLEIASDVRQAIRNVDPDVATYDVRTMDDHLESGSNGFAIFRLAALAAGLFGGMGVLLASIGLYGMMAYHVSQRTHEIGVRMALGARGGDIIRDVLTYGGRVALLGIVIGVLLAAGLAQLLRRLLLDVSPLDPLTYTAVALLVIAITVLASFVPARRATIVDPMVALRTD